MNDSQKVNEIFDRAKQQEPYYSDASFTSQVNVGIKGPRTPRRFMDGTIMAIATLLGITIIYSQIPLDLLVSNIPTSIVINPISLVLAAGLSSALCYFTYFVLED